MSETSVRRRVDVGRVILVVEGVLLLLLGVAALVTAKGVVAGFQVNLPHAIALAATGLVALTVAATRRLVLPFAVVQLLVYGAAFLYGANIQGQHTGDMWQFNQADSWLHLGVAIVALVIGFAVAAARGARQRHAK
jgi:glucan phosphoethanolaminetransferase (alkaline phosphatase superfamily)